MKMLLVVVALLFSVAGAATAQEKQPAQQINRGCFLRNESQKSLGRFQK